MKQLLIAIVSLISSLTYAQSTGSINGKVLDAEMYNEPLLMATVSLKNTDWSTYTNFNGNFEITDVAPGEYTLLVHFLGYEEVELPVTISYDDTTYIQCSLHAKTMQTIDLAQVNPKSEQTKSIIKSEQ
ncbi:carboxypeptidase-like regulatory domain-containing protein [Maribacter thermophilus]|uniref:carboxypeptidase-like regulatory domain-containing protein n=1 Tax=Maribacter thermophilus TaxID=1197874 RepID=UPI000640E29C|nr:carboxypeptidase-like regulatory domain-containing protein [Maribacter thermophilus]